MSGPRFFRALPIVAGLTGYRPAWLRDDIAAGLAIAAVSIPTAIAYPAIAGLPPEVGLYASIAPLLAYAVFGPSRQLIVGPDAATITVLAAVLGTTLQNNPSLTEADRIAAASIVALGVGVICFLAKTLRLGMLASLLSRPILTGFFAGISLDILIGQLGRVTGLKISSDGLVPPLVELVSKLGSIHLPSLILALFMLIILEGAKVTRFAVPGPVLVVVLALLLSWSVGLEGRGVAVVGSISSGLPPLRLPSVGNLPIGDLILGSAVVFIVTFGSGIITARSFAAKTGATVDANRELAGFGAANIASGLFGSFPVTAADSRTAVNLSVGGRSQLAGIAAAFVLIGTLLFLSDLLRLLPIPALGAILVSAALHMIDVASLREIWRISRLEFSFALIAMSGAVSFGVLKGVGIAIAATLAYVLYKGMQPRVVLCGRIPGRGGFYKLHRFDAAKPVPGLVICVVQGSLLFFSADEVRRRLFAIADELPSATRWFVLDAAAVSMVDSSGAAVLEDFHAELDRRKILLGIAELHGEARALLDRVGVIRALTPSMIFEDLEDALLAYQRSDDSAGTSDSAHGHTTPLTGKGIQRPNTSHPEGLG